MSGSLTHYPFSAISARIFLNFLGHVISAERRQAGGARSQQAVRRLRSAAEPQRFKVNGLFAERPGYVRREASRDSGCSEKLVRYKRYAKAFSFQRLADSTSLTTFTSHDMISLNAKKPTDWRAS